MAKTFFTADTHFNHASVIKYRARPFASIDEMNRGGLGVDGWRPALEYESLNYGVK